MALLWDERLVEWNITAQHASQKPCLDEKVPRDHDLLIDDRVLECLSFAFLVGLDDGFASIGGQLDRAAFANGKIVRLDLLAVDESDRQTVCKPWTELLHEIERERGAVGAFGMEKSHEGIQSRGGQCGDAIVPDERIEEGQKTVHAIQRWLPGSETKHEIRLLLFEQVTECGEVGLGSRTFQSPDRVCVWSFRKPGDQTTNGLRGIHQCFGGDRIWSLPRSTQQRISRVVEFSCHNTAANLGAQRAIVTGTKLRTPQGDTRIGHTRDAGMESAILIQIIDGDRVLQSQPHRPGTEQDLRAEHTNALHMVNRKRELELTLELDPKREMIPRDIESGSGEVENVLDDFGHDLKVSVEGGWLRVERVNAKDLHESGDPPFACVAFVKRSSIIFLFKFTLGKAPGIDCGAGLQPRADKYRGASTRRIGV